MEEEMEELYIEGLANHDDREPCVGAREGAGEASVAARAGQVIEPRNHRVRGSYSPSVSVLWLVAGWVGWMVATRRGGLLTGGPGW